MNIEQLTSSTVLAVLILLSLAFVRFGVWWGILRAVIGPLLRPAGLTVVAVAVFAVMKLG